MDLVEKILAQLNAADKVNTKNLAVQFNVDHQKVVGALKSIQANGELVQAELVTEKALELTDEGKSVAEKGIYNHLLYVLCIPNILHFFRKS